MAITDYHKRKQAMKDLIERTSDLYEWIERKDINGDFAFTYITDQLEQIIDELKETDRHRLFVVGR